MCAPGEKMSNVVVGVDVGGTYTDAVLFEIPKDDKKPKVLASAKSLTTPDVMTGVVKSLQKVTDSVDTGKIEAVMVGTTKFVNAVLSHSTELAPVAAIRVCGCTTRAYPPFFDFPDDLEDLICAHIAFVDGGYEVDGKAIDEVDEDQIKQVCAKIKSKGIQSVAICGVFASLNPDQEIKVGEIVRQELGDSVYVTLSHEIAHVGLLKRENAAILNASLRPLATKFIHALEEGIRNLSMTCPVFLTQNDGTLLSTTLAEAYPVRTFKSGPTNSMRGAAFLSGIQDCIVVDMGGTSSDIGTLRKGFPKPTSVATTIGGVPTSGNMPDVLEIALGGGTTVEVAGGDISFGRSIAARLDPEARIFGGDTLTTTDCAVAAGLADIGDRTNVAGLSADIVRNAIAGIRALLAENIRGIKVTADDIKVVLVGGGSELIDIEEKMDGVSELIRPQHFAVANAVGAAMCQVSGYVDRVLTELPDEGQERQDKLDVVKSDAIAEAVKKGAIKGTIKIIDFDAVNLAYLPGTARVLVKAVGELDIGNLDSVKQGEFKRYQEPAPFIRPDPPNRPDIGENKENAAPIIEPETNLWVLTTHDVDKITIGCSILGSGGGGRPDLQALRLKKYIVEGKRVTIMRADELEEGKHAVGGANMGAPTINGEKPSTGNECLNAVNSIVSSQGVTLGAVLCLEMGGTNCISPLLVVAVREPSIPVIDADCMGRAFPRLEMTTLTLNGMMPYPACLADDKGNSVVVPHVKSFVWLERLMRAVVGEMGSWAAFAFPPLSREQVTRVLVPNTYSQSWRIGQTVLQARGVEDVTEAVARHTGGRVIFSGRISGVDRKTIGGFDFGIVILEGAPGSQFEGKNLRVDYQNEFLIASTFSKINGKPDKTIFEHMQVGQDICGCCPDIIAMLDEKGDTVFSEEVRYGLDVSVLCIPINEQMRTEEALKILGPRAFKYDVDYKPVAGPPVIESLINPRT